MTSSLPPDNTHRLRSLMQSMGVSSFKALSRLAGVSEWQVQQIRQGRIEQMQVGQVQKLAQALGRSLPELLNLFAEGKFSESAVLSEVVTHDEQFPHSNPAVGATRAETSLLETKALETKALETKVTQLQQEYQRLQSQLAEQQNALRQEFQQSSLQVLESLVLQLPTAIYAAQQNPQIPAARLLPLLRPIDQLLQSWGIETIAPVGTELEYDPQWHQLMEGTAPEGDPLRVSLRDRVRVRYAGYRQGDKLLYRAKVSPSKREERTEKKE